MRPFILVLGTLNPLTSTLSPPLHFPLQDSSGLPSPTASDTLVDMVDKAVAEAVPASAEAAKKVLP